MNILLQDDRVDPSARNNLAIKEAARYGEVDIVEILLHDQRVDPSASDNLALSLASRYGKINLVDKFINSIESMDIAHYNGKNCYERIVITLLKDHRVSNDMDELSNNSLEIY